LSARVCKDAGRMKRKTSAAVSGHTTVDPVQMPPASSIIQRDPEFIRLPKSPRLCPYSGLSRSKLNELILPCPANDHKPPVRSVVLRQKGKVKGVRLIVFKSTTTSLSVGARMTSVT
jgi:hypothetical protein